MADFWRIWALDLNERKARLRMERNQLLRAHQAICEVIKQSEPAPGGTPDYWEREARRRLAMIEEILRIEGWVASNAVVGASQPEVSRQHNAISPGVGREAGAPTNQTAQAVQRTGMPAGQTPAPLDGAVNFVEGD